MKYDFKNLSEEEIIQLIENFDLFLQDIPEEYRTEAICLESIKVEEGFSFKIIDNPTEEMKLIAVRENGWNIEFIDNPSLEIELEAVKQNGYVIKYIPNPSKKVQLEAIKNDGNSIQFIDNPTEEMKLMAIKQNGCSIQYIPNPSEELQLEAVKQVSHSIQYINNPTEAVIFESVKQDYHALVYIQNPSIDLCIIAVKQNPESLLCINVNLLEEVLKYFPNIKIFECGNKILICEFINNEWLFTIGCENRINKEQFVDRIYNSIGGLEYKKHREEYLKILEQF